MLPKTYEPKSVEGALTAKWQEHKLFSGRLPEDRSKKSFVIVIPPPNITGALHVGHALNNTLQDTLIRANRMMGRQAFWVPGTDHGGIATQSVVEKKIAKERKLRRHDLGREKFLEEMWQWRKECGDTILLQLNKLGTALDLSPENVRFTMDEARAESVYESFRRLWEKKYIYRGERMINWCVRCGTALSDIEVEHETFNSKLWHIHYYQEDGGKGITVATTRPETLLGDTAVAVNPEDSRYKHLVGKKLRLPLTDRLIPVIADSEVDSSFGTGAVKITPAHDPVDHEMGLRHNLEHIIVISPEGKMVNCPAKYIGMDRSAARHAILEDLKAANLLEKEEHYSHSVGTCYRCNQEIEPYLSEQWFVKMKDLAAPAIEAAETGKVKFHPESWKKPFVDWLSNIQDWCISRQIWWGHRVPVWYCRKCSGAGLKFQTGKDGKTELTRVSFKDGAKPIVSFHKPDKCPDCGGHDLVQDPDVLDTWFSSGLWPFSVFGWPRKTAELDYFYPTSVLSTGYEILYLWVARMVMLGIEFMGRVPFSDVYLHGIVRDKHGKKMSKSLGNVIDPLDLMDKYGTDAVRFALVSQSVPGRDIPFGEESMTGPRNFCNKIYNAARFIQMNLPENAGLLPVPGKPAVLADQWILHRYNIAMRDARQSILEYDLSKAANTLYHFLWDEYCDWYVELAKPRLATAEKEQVLGILTHVLWGTLKALHPMMPFITEELSSSLRPLTGGKQEFLLNESYPEANPAWDNEKAALEMETVMGITVAIRTIRSQFGVPPGNQIKASVSANSAESLDIVRRNESYITLLAKISGLESGSDMARPNHSATAVFKDLTIFVPLEGLIDFEKEKARLQKELDKLVKEEEMCSHKLDDKVFMSHAPEKEVQKIRARHDEARLKIKGVEASLKELS